MKIATILAIPVRHDVLAVGLRGRTACTKRLEAFLQILLSLFYDMR